MVGRVGWRVYQAATALDLGERILHLYEFAIHLDVLIKDFAGNHVVVPSQWRPGGLSGCLALQ